MMKDWECMTDILLEAPDQEEDRTYSTYARTDRRLTVIAFQLSTISMRTV